MDFVTDLSVYTNKGYNISVLIYRESIDQSYNISNTNILVLKVLKRLVSRCAEKMLWPMKLLSMWY